MWGLSRICYKTIMSSILNNFDNSRNNHNDEQFKLLLRKGVYPYEYMSNWDKFEEEDYLLWKSFTANLTWQKQHAGLWTRAKSLERIQAENLGEYNDLYLKTDELLLSKVFETFRNTCSEHYKLNPANFYTSLGWAWQACLKKTSIRLEPLTDLNMLLMFEKVFEVELPRMFIDMQARFDTSK